MKITSGINHIGLSVFDLEASTRFFVEYLGWDKSGFDEKYPRIAVTDGLVKITLWQVDRSSDVTEFDRRRNVGLHHLALHIENESTLHELHKTLETKSDVGVEFPPQLMGEGPRKHFMIVEPGGIRIEFTWSGI